MSGHHWAVVGEVKPKLTVVGFNGEIVGEVDVE